MSKATVEFAYPLVCVPRRARSERKIWVRDRVDVEIADVSASESPLGVAVRDIRLAGTLHVDEERYDIGGMPHKGVSLLGEGRSIGFETCGVHLLKWKTPWARLNEVGMSRERPLGLERIVHDGRDEVIATIADAATKVFLREGRQLMVPRALPGPALWPVFDIAVLSHQFRHEHGVESGYAFSLWRTQDALDVAEVATRGGYTIQHTHFGAGRGAIYKLEGDEGRFPQDLRAINVREASNQMRLRMGKHIKHLDPGAILQLAMLADAAERVDGDTAQIERAKALISGFPEMVKGPGSNVAARDAELAVAARDAELAVAAIEMSERALALVPSPAP